MHAFSATGSSAAFKSSAGDLTLTANLDGKWHFYRKCFSASADSNKDNNDEKGDDEKDSENASNNIFSDGPSDHLYDHFLIDYSTQNARTTRTTRTTGTARPSYDSYRSYPELHSGNYPGLSSVKREYSDSHSNPLSPSVPCVPSVIRILEGISQECSSSWLEHDVRRYALLSNLFGEDSADSGELDRM